MAVNEGEQVLEVGYGTGHSLVALANAVGDSGHVCGVDIAQGMTEVASRRIERAGLDSRVSLQVAEVPPLPVDEAQFDAVSICFTLELFPLETIPDVLAEVSRVLVPGGRLGVVSMATVRPKETDSALEVTYKWMHHHFPHIVDCQPIEVETHLANAGFEIVTDHRMDIFTMPVAAVIGRKPS